MEPGTFCSAEPRPGAPSPSGAGSACGAPAETASEWQTQDRDVSCPFSVQLANETQKPDPLVCREVVRHLPQRRLVCRGRWRDKEVFAKLFLDPRRGGRDREQELRGIFALRDRGILGPEVLFAGSEVEKGLSVIILQAVAGGRRLGEILKNAAEPEKEILVARLLRLLAQHHARGLSQRDLHLNNFLVAEDGIYTLDGADVEISERPLGRQASLFNLAIFLAQLPDDEHWSSRWLREYAALRGWELGVRDLRTLRRALARVTRYRRRRLLRKVLRDCSDFVSVRTPTRRLAYVRSCDTPAMRAFLADPSQSLGRPSSRLLKLGNTATVWLAEIDGRRLVVKRYNIKSLGHGVRRALRTTRAALCWRNAHLLRFYGIRTAPPVAFREERWGPVRRTSFFVAEYVAGTDCHDFLCDPRISPRERKAVIERIADLLRRLARLRFSHGDLKANNVFVVDARPVLIDLDALRQHISGWRARRGFARDVMRFLQNWSSRPEILNPFRKLLNRGG
jgi:tRNA A-37 threonylcarbamoyl transferase component Bud32